MSKTLSRSSYLEKNVGDFPAEFEIAGVRYEKADDLRYGTNPHQPAAYYRPAGVCGVIGGMEIIKNGKSGLSQNLTMLSAPEISSKLVWERPLLPFLMISMPPITPGTPAGR